MNWFRRWLRDRPNEVFIVLDGGRVVGVSAVLQGAELIRADEARRIAEHSECDPDWRGGEDIYAAAYEAMRVENVDVRDCDQ